MDMDMDKEGATLKKRDGSIDQQNSWAREAHK